MIDKTTMPKAEQALPGRREPMKVSARHSVLDATIKPPFPADSAHIVLGLGCFWGAERAFWKLDGVYTTAVGYSAGLTPNPTYEEVCSGLTGHNEVVLVVYFPEKISLRAVLKKFWESHDPTQGMRQGNDRGTQYRSGIYYFDDKQKACALESQQAYQRELAKAGFATITTEIIPASEFYYAEDYHQQYLHKNPKGYCGLGGTGVPCSLTPQSLPS